MNRQFLRLTSIAALVLYLSAAQAMAQLGIKFAGSVQKKDGPMQVTVAFTEPIDPATGGNKANYNLGAGVTINNAQVVTGLPGLDEPGNGDPPLRGRVISNQAVILEVTGLGSADVTLTVNGVQNAAKTETLTGATFKFTPSGYLWTDVARLYTSPSDPGWVAPGRKPGIVLADSNNGFDIYNNGRTGWGNEDEFTFVYKEVTGDFDFKSRIEFQDSSSRWARAGIQVREALDDGAAEGCMHRYVTAHANPPTAFSDTAAGVVAGNNMYESNYRLNHFVATSPGCGDGSHTAFGSDTAGNGGGTPIYPIAWVRLTRVGDLISAYYSNDGETWSDPWERDFSTSDNGPLPAKMYLGPAYSAEWGNINAANGEAVRSRYYLTHHRWGPLTTPYVPTLNGSPSGFIATVQDVQSKFDKSTLKAWLDNVPLDPSTLTVVGPDANGLSTITYKAPTFLKSGQVYNARIEFKDTATPTANVVTKAGSFTLNYLTVPAGYAASSVSGAKGTMMVGADKLNSGIRPDTIAGIETELQGGVVDAEGNPVGSAVSTNLTELVGPVNFTQAPADAGWFNATNTPEYPDGPMPGGVDGDQYALRFQGFLELKAGAYRMYVNSDDGFKLSLGPNAGDVLGLTVGSFEPTRGMTLNNDPAGFDLVVPVDGNYPFRLTYGQGTGNASVEWYIKDMATGTRYLINGNEAAAPKTFPSGQGRAYVSHFLPYPGTTTVLPTPVFDIQITDAATTVASDAVQLTLDGAKVTPTVSKTGGITKVTWSPASPYPLESQHTGQFVYAESSGVSVTNNFTFQVKGFGVADLSPGSFWIEAEDFDYDGGKHMPDADNAIGTSASPYLGGAYEGLGAITSTDFFDDGPPDSNNYRTEELPADATGDTNGVNADNNLGGQYGSARPGNVTMTTSYKLGWMGGGVWFNYTRKIPAGTYTAYAALSVDVTEADALDAYLDRITSGVGQPDAQQTKERLGRFLAPGSGAWGRNQLAPLYKSATDRTRAVFTITGTGDTTLRFTSNRGDFDWFTLVPATPGPTEVKITGFTVTGGNITITWTGGGTLQSSPTVNGGWTDQAGAANGTFTGALTGAQRFFRVRP